MRIDQLSLLLLSALLHRTFAQLRQYVYVPVSVNWTDAQKYCRQRYTDLITIYGQADLDELQKTAGMGNVWLGLHRTQGNGDFVWSDRRSSSFRKWNFGQPNAQLCVNTYNGNWYDRDCEDYAPFACYIEKKRQVIRVEVKSGQNVNDPVVMKEILEKMERTLKEKGLAQYAKLSFRTQSNGNVFQKKYQMNNTKPTCV
ncbi:C-type Lectin CRL-like [Pimephales promelas]|uniref:C-type Lectin CRL-like n=1 Tax=Pimephales promelas TaxID=90988 RepID=UPI001955E38B|nr:C-type Lectin CRL-like [Pimephales promelas]XP_039505288.1 C-type Lectin CRL-like [Pimephales promelas]